MITNKIKIIFFSVLIIFFLPWQALCIPYIGIEGGLLFIGNAEEVSAPSPVILQGLGCVIPLFDFEPFFLETGILLFGTQYQYANDRAAPADIERKDNLWVLATQLDIKLGMEWDIITELGFGVTFGPTFLFRIPIIAYDDGEQYRQDMITYFFSGLRFFYPEIAIYLKWALAEELHLCFTIRGLLPIYNLWNEENMPFWDNLIIETLLCLRIML